MQVEKLKKLWAKWVIMDFMEQTYQRTGLGPNWDGLGRGEFAE